MAESVILRSSASPKNASPTSANPQVKTSGPLPLVQVTMGSGNAPKQAGENRSVTLGPVRGGVTRDGKVIQARHAPQLAARGVQVQQALPAPSAMMPEQLMLCRHLTSEYLKAQQEAAAGEDPPAETAANVELAEATIAAIDAALAPPVPARRPLPPVLVDNRVDHRPQAGANRRIAAPAPPPVVVAMDDGGVPHVEG